jgi:hypothetical protein
MDFARRSLFPVVVLFSLAGSGLKAQEPTTTIQTVNVSWPEWFDVPNAGSMTLNEHYRSEDNICYHARHEGLHYVYSTTPKGSAFKIANASAYACSGDGAKFQCMEIGDTKARMERGNKGAFAYSWSIRAFPTQFVIQTNGDRVELLYKVNAKGGLPDPWDWDYICKESFDIAAHGSLPVAQ